MAGYMSFLAASEAVEWLSIKFLRFGPELADGLSVAASNEATYLEAAGVFTLW